MGITKLGYYQTCILKWYESKNGKVKAMSELNHKFLRLVLGFLIPGLLLCFFPSNLVAKQATIKEIRIQQHPFSVKFFISDTIPIKVIQVEKRELLVALKNATFEKGFAIKGRDPLSIKQVAIEKLPGDVIAVILTSAKPYEYVRSGFNPSDSSFTINFEKQKRYIPNIFKQISQTFDIRHKTHKI